MDLIILVAGKYEETLNVIVLVVVILNVTVIGTVIAEAIVIVVIVAGKL